jgi:hypothetical protein
LFWTDGTPPSAASAGREARGGSSLTCQVSRLPSLTCDTSQIANNTPVWARIEPGFKVRHETLFELLEGGLVLGRECERFFRVTERPVVQPGSRGGSSLTCQVSRLPSLTCDTSQIANYLTLRKPRILFWTDGTPPSAASAGREAIVFSMYVTRRTASGPTRLSRWVVAHLPGVSTTLTDLRHLAGTARNSFRAFGGRPRSRSRMRALLSRDRSARGSSRPTVGCPSCCATASCPSTTSGFAT